MRDSLMGRTPSDWDITTSAFPEETKAVFKDYRTIDTGIKHGTVTGAYWRRAGGDNHLPTTENT